jgi:hypothetical protein
VELRAYPEQLDCQLRITDQPGLLEDPLRGLAHLEGVFHEFVGGVLLKLLRTAD